MGLTVHTHTHTHTHTHSEMCVYMHVHTRLLTYTCTCALMHTHIYSLKQLEFVLRIFLPLTCVCIFLSCAHIFSPPLPPSLSLSLSLSLCVCMCVCVCVCLELRGCAGLWWVGVLDCQKRTAFKSVILFTSSSRRV